MSSGFSPRVDNYSLKKVTRSPIHSTYAFKTVAKILEGKKPDKKGIVDAVPIKTVVKVDEYDMHKKIQEYRDETNLTLIVKKCIATGDTSLLNSHKGEYGDVSNIPVDKVEASNLAKENFSKGSDIASKMGLTGQQLLNMSQEELDTYIKNAVEKLNNTNKGGATNGEE